VVRHTGWAIHHTSKAVHRLLIIAIGLLVIASCLLAGAAWRLAQGPIDLGAYADRLRAALADESLPVRVSFDGLVLAWEGFDKGVDHPLDLRVSNISIADLMGRKLITAPDAHLTFSLAGLLLGRLVPRTVEVDHAQVAVTRDATGSINLDLNSDGGARGDMADAGAFDLRQLRRDLVHPASTDHGRSRGLLDQMRRAHFRDATVTFRDRGSGMVAHVTGMDLNLVRASNGRIRGTLRAPLTMREEQTTLTAALDLEPGRADSNLDLRLTAFRPSALGTLPPDLAVLRALDVPVSISASVTFGAGFDLGHMNVMAALGTGRLLIAQGAVPLRGGSVALSGTADRIAITKIHLDVAQTADGAAQTVDLTGTVARVSDRINAAVTVALDRVDIAGLPQLWPAGIADDARAWVTEHVTGGMATRGSVSLVIEADAAMHDVVLTKATGELEGSNGTFTWLDNMPPVEQAEVRLRLVDPDTLDIHLTAGRQRIANRGPDLVLRDGQMRIVGLSLKDQSAEIRAQIEGQVVSAIALLSEPRLNLLSIHPIGLKPAAGEASATLSFRFPLQNKLRMDDVQIRADARLTHVRVPDVAGGHVLDDGTFDLGVDKDGLSVKGRGSLAEIPVTVDGTMDFRPGPADQIVQKIAVAGRPDAVQLEAAGLPVTEVVSGPVAMTAVMTERRNGAGSVAVGGDLTQASLAIGPLAWSKPAGIAANASATLLMSRDRLTRIERIVVRGDTILLAGSADFTDGRVRSVKLDTIRLGRTRGHGVVHVAPNNEIAVALQGAVIDLSAKLTEKNQGADPQNAVAATTPLWSLDARFDQAILADGETAADILVNATGAGNTIRTLDALGSQAGAGFSLRIAPRAGKRRLLVDAKDAGRFLRGMDAVRGVQSGHLILDAVFDNPLKLQPLVGTVTITDAVVRNSPVLGKLLQAITLYGLVDALRGPGMTFSTIVLPFRYEGNTLNLNDAHAENSSLGLTAKGRIGLSSGDMAISGTLVPAYFFNSMLGQLPLIGKLFSPEKGGGVFAARFGVEGPIEDPTISINPISALTPGFLREIFSIFDSAGTAATPPKPAPN
jgi:hypothetical protein